MLLNLLGTESFTAKMVKKNLEFVELSLQVVFCAGPGFIDQTGKDSAHAAVSKPIMVTSSGLPFSGILDKFDEMVDEGAKMVAGKGSSWRAALASSIYDGRQCQTCA